MLRNLITKEIAIKNIKDKISELNKLPNKNLSFLGFVDNEWKGQHNTFLILKCNIHNIVWTTTSYANFINKSKGNCSECQKLYTRQSNKLTPEEAMSKVIDIHKDDNIKYDYSNIENTFTGIHNKVEISCLLHGKFSIDYVDLLTPNKGKCPQCIKEEKSKNQIINVIGNKEIFDKIQNKIAKIKTDYDIGLKFLGFYEENCKNIIPETKARLILKCNEHNVIWNTTPLDNFIRLDGIFCPECAKNRSSSTSNTERKCSIILQSLDSTLEINRHLKLTVTDKICNKERLIIPDIYLPSLNAIIEYDGEQHYKFIEKYHKLDYNYYVDRINRDNCLVQYCKENNIRLLRIPWKDNNRLEEVIKAFLVEGKDITTKVEPKLLPAVIIK